MVPLSEEVCAQPSWGKAKTHDSNDTKHARRTSFTGSSWIKKYKGTEMLVPGAAISATTSAQGILRRKVSSLRKSIAHILQFEALFRQGRKILWLGQHLG